MLRHVVIWKLKEDVADLAAVKAGIRTSLEGLVGTVPGLLRAKVYADGADARDVLLEAYLASRDALAAYAAHPAHVAAAETFVKPFVASRTAFDFDAGTELDELIYERRSIRAFKPEPPPSELVDEVVKAGLLAPTGRNKQSTVVIRLDDPAIREAVRAKNEEIRGAPPAGRVNDPFYAAPVMLLVVANKANDTAVYDGSLALGNMMLKAHELGLAACWIHRAKPEIDSPLGRTILDRAGLVGDYEGVGHLALGYAACPLPAPHPYNPARYRAV